MRKNYIKPMGNVIALRMDENVALSLGFIDVIYDFTLAYRPGEDGQRYIKDTQVVASNLAGEVGATVNILKLVDAVMDAVAGRGPAVTGWENCNSNPEVDINFQHLN